MHILTYLGFLLLGVLFTGLAFIALLDVVRGTPIRAVGERGDPTGCPPVDDPFFREAMELFTHTELRPGHDVEVYKNGDETYPRLWADLRGARSSITIQLYYCNKGRMADELQQILLDRARAGVRVYFLYDSFGTTLPKEYFEPLREAGVACAAFRPVRWASLRKAHHRAHIRVIVVDGVIGYTGGFGIDDKWYGDGRHEDQWRDTNVRFTGPAVRQLQAIFAVCWSEASGRLLTSDRLFPPEERPDMQGEPDSPGPLTRTDGAIAGVIHASPAIGSTAAERFFVLSIAAARKNLYIANSYFVPNRKIRNLLREAARRHVDVRILTTSRHTDVKSTWYAGRARYDELLRDGVRIFEYQPVMMHAKTLAVDGRWGSVGSMNADNRSLSFNEESNFIALDDTVAQCVERLFIEDLAYADEIHRETFARRPLTARCAELACYFVRRVL